MEKGKQRSLEHSRSDTSSSSSSDSDSDAAVKVKKKNVKKRGKMPAHLIEGESDRYLSDWEREYEQDETYDGVFDAMGKIFDKEGLTGFYHGIGWELFGTVSSNVWYFAVCKCSSKTSVDNLDIDDLIDHVLRRQRLKIMGTPKSKAALPIFEELSIGIMAAAVSRFISAPLSTVVARKQTSAMMYPHARPPSFLDIYHEIMRESGLGGFWAGYTASLFLTINPSLTFLLFETAKPHVRETNGGKLDGVDSFFLGALCKAMATTLTYPFHVAQARAQHEGTGKELEMEEMYHGALEASAGYSMDRGMSGNVSSRSGKGKKPQVPAAALRMKKQKVLKAKGLIDTLVYIVKKEGLGALYVGLGAELVKGFFTHGKELPVVSQHHDTNIDTGLTMLAKEAVHRSILKLYYYVLELYNESSWAQRQTHRAQAFTSNVRDKAASVRGSQHGHSHQAQELQEHQSRSNQQQQISDRRDIHRSRSQQNTRTIVRDTIDRDGRHVHEEHTFTNPAPPQHLSRQEFTNFEHGESGGHSYNTSHSHHSHQRSQSTPTFRSMAAPKTVASVEKWMDRVHTETTAAAAAAAVTKPGAGFMGSNGGGSGSARMPGYLRDSHGGVNSPEQRSLASGNTGRTSLRVHPPSQRGLGERLRVEREATGDIQGEWIRRGEREGKDW